MRCSRCGNDVGDAEVGAAVDPKVHRVAIRLRRECLEIFGSTWGFKVAWQLAQAAIDEIEGVKETPEGRQ